MSVFTLSFAISPCLLSKLACECVLDPPTSHPRVQHMGRTWRCQICKSHRSQWPRTCQVCKRWVLPGCNPEWCLAQDEGSEDEPRPAICKECFVSVRQAIAPLTRTMPRALEVVRDRNWVLHKFDKQPDVMLLSHSF